MNREFDNHTGNLSGIYAICNNVTGDHYIGQTLNSFRVRFNAHTSRLQRGKSDSPILQRAWDKYGSDNFSFKVLEVIRADKETIEEREQYWMDHYRGFCRVYNCGSYGASPRLGQRNSPLHIIKSALAHIGRKVSAEGKQRMSDSQKERFQEQPHPRSGTKHTAESLERMRQIKLGKRASTETKDRMASSHRGMETAAKPFPSLVNVETGEVANGTNLARFCRERGLSRVCMNYVISGKQKNHKGWQLHDS